MERLHTSHPSHRHISIRPSGWPCRRLNNGAKSRSLFRRMSMEEHVNRLVRSCFYQRQSIRFIRRFLSLAVETSLTNSFIIARIDYCKSIIAGLTKHQTGRIRSQRALSMLARFDHSTPTLRDRLHWLRVSQRIEFKRCLLVYKEIHGLASAYITNQQLHRNSIKTVHPFIRAPATPCSLLPRR